MNWLDKTVNENKGIGMIDGESKEYESLTIEKVIEIVESLTIVSERLDVNGLELYQECKTNGGVIRTISNLNLCDDDTCVSCMEWKVAMSYGVTRIEEPEIKMRLGDEDE